MALRILIADDNEINREFLVGVLTGQRYRIAQAEDGQSAIDQCRQLPFDVILMDIRMPGVDGIEATREIRRMAGYENVPILALTADLQAQQREQLLQQGFTATLAKPISRQTLLDAIGDSTHGGEAPQPPQATDKPPIDTEVALAAAGGNRELVKRLTTMLLKELERFAPAITEAVSEGDYASAREMAHKLRASAGYCGARPLQASAAALEDALTADPPRDLDGALQQFQHEVQRLEAHLGAASR